MISRRTLRFLALFALHLSLTLLIIYCSILAHTQWNQIKNNTQLKTSLTNAQWSFWDYLWRSGEVMHTWDGIVRQKNYQSQHLPNLVTQLFTGTKNTTSSTSTTHDWISNFQSFNITIQFSVFLIFAWSIVTLIIFYLLSRELWSWYLNQNSQFAQTYRRLRYKSSPWTADKNLIEINNLSFTFNKTQILNNINLKIKKGSLNIIIGPNGSGKTTLLKNLINIYQPTQGTIKWHDQPISSIHPTEFARHVSYIPQFLNLQNSIGVLDFLEFARYPYRQMAHNSPEKDRNIIRQALGKMHALALREKIMDELSGGQRQKVILTNVLVQESEVIVLDEPTTYLDLKTQHLFLKMLRNLKEQGKTIIMILHDLSQSLEWADNLIVMKDGSIYDSGRPQEIVNTTLLENVFRITCDIIKTPTGVYIKNIHAL